MDSQYGFRGFVTCRMKVCASYFSTSSVSPQQPLRGQIKKAFTKSEQTPYAASPFPYSFLSNVKDLLNKC